VPKNEDGEFELILGNRQLFSVFFIVVMLFGVFFVMGYIVGQNSAPLGRTEVASARKNDVKPIVVDSPGRAAEAPAAAAPEPSTAALDTPPAETAPQRPPAAPEKRPEKAPEKPKPEPKAEPKSAAKATPPPPPPARAEAGQPAAGDYLQLVATAKGQADDLVDVLRKNGFRALNYEVPEKPGLFRVLVGPVKDGEMNKLRADLQGKGFQGREAIPKKF
jgi:cell division septation protein DedD